MTLCDYECEANFSFGYYEQIEICLSIFGSQLNFFIAMSWMVLIKPQTISHNFLAASHLNLSHWMRDSSQFSNSLLP